MAAGHVVATSSRLFPLSSSFDDQKGHAPMALLTDLRADPTLFHTALPQKPQGRYVHFVLMRETESFPLFQTDGTLNVIRVRAGASDPRVIMRLMLFKRKQSSPERLTGRELLRYYDI